MRQDFTIEALRDTHLLASAQPVRWRPGTEAPVADADGDARRRAGHDPAQPALHGLELRRRGRTRASSNAFRGDYPEAAQRYLEVVYQPVPEWGTPNRDTLMAVFFGASDEFEITSLESVYEAALGVTSGAQSPYEAAALLETWFRQAGGFTYDEQPPAPIGGDAAARRLRQRDEARLLPALRRARWRSCSGFSASRRASPSGSRAASTTRATKEWIGHRHERARLGRGLVPRVRLDPVRPDARTGGSSRRPTRSRRSRSTPATRPTGSTGPPTRRAAGGAGEPIGSLPKERLAPADRRCAVVRDQGPGLCSCSWRGSRPWARSPAKVVRRRVRYLTRDPRGSPARPGVARRLPRRPGRRRAPSATPEELRQLCGSRRDGQRSSATLAAARFGPPEAGAEAATRARRELRALLRVIRGWAQPSGTALRLCRPPVSAGVKGAVSETYDLYQQGRSHLAAGQAAQATVALEKAKKREPNKASIREALGIAYYRIPLAPRPRRSSGRSSSSSRSTTTRTSPSGAASRSRGGRRGGRPLPARVACVAEQRALPEGAREARQGAGRSAGGRPAGDRGAGRVGGEIVGEVGRACSFSSGSRRTTTRRSSSGSPGRSRACGSSRTRTGKLRPLAARRRRRCAGRQPVHADRRHAKGNRPSFAGAAPPEQAELLYEGFCDSLRATGSTSRGRFGARMSVELANDGPVTITLDA